MRSLSLLAALGVGGVLVVACGSEDDAGFTCIDSMISHGAVTQCEASGQFQMGTPAYTCESAGSSSRRGDVAIANLCPTGTGVGRADDGRAHEEQRELAGREGDAAAEDNVDANDANANDANANDEKPASSEASGESDDDSCETGYKCSSQGKSAKCACTRCDEGYHPSNGACVPNDPSGKPCNKKKHKKGHHH